MQEDRKIRKEILSVQRSQIFTPKPNAKPKVLRHVDRRLCASLIPMFVLHTVLIRKSQSAGRPVQLEPLEEEAAASDGAAGSFFLTQTDP